VKFEEINLKFKKFEKVQNVIKVEKVKKKFKIHIQSHQTVIERHSVLSTL